MKGDGAILFLIFVALAALLIVPLMLLNGGPFDVQSAGLQRVWDGVWNVTSNTLGVEPDYQGFGS